MAHVTKIRLSSKAPILLVDASYYVIHRFFATSRWWTFQNTAKGLPAAAPTQLLDNEEFRTAFLKHIDGDIEKLQKRWGLTGRGKKPIAPKNIVFCKDCPRSTIWRMDHYDDYKKTRQMNANFDTRSFSCFSTQVTQDVGEIELDNDEGPDSQWFQSVSHPRLEADDVACLLFRKIRSTMGSEQKVVFITGDHDYLQLKDEHSEIYGLPDKNLWEAGIKKGTNDITHKILMGDKSDNIPAVLNKKQIAHYMSLEEDTCREAYLAKMGKLDAYNLNKTLMCWSQIPADIADAFHSRWEVVDDEKSIM